MGLARKTKVDNPEQQKAAQPRSLAPEETNEGLGGKNGTSKYI